MAGERLEHPAIVRLSHWLTALAVSILTASGLEIRHYLLRAPSPSGHGTYNPLQKLACTTVILLAVVLVVTGLALYKPVQLSRLVAVLGGFPVTRVWHFAAMCGLLAFVPGHVVMVVLHGWHNFSSLWTGGRRSEDGPDTPAVAHNRGMFR